MAIFEEIKRLQEELEQERRWKKEWQERCSKLEQELRDLKAVLNRILNPDTPSSQIPDTEKETNRSPSRDPVGTRSGWAHLLRRTFFMKKNNPTGDIVQLHEQLTALYQEAEKYRTMNLTDSERIWTGIRLIQKLQRITYSEWKSSEAKSIAENWLKTFSGQWLVGIFIPQVEFTNNKDERGIRKVIPTRKMLGGHRTQEGADDFAIIETNRQTWKLQEKSPYAELVKYLQEDNAQALATA